MKNKNDLTNKNKYKRISKNKNKKVINYFKEQIALSIQFLSEKEAGRFNTESQMVKLKAIKNSNNNNNKVLFLNTSINSNSNLSKNLNYKTVRNEENKKKNFFYKDLSNDCKYKKIQLKKNKEFKKLNNTNKKYNKSRNYLNNINKKRDNIDNNNKKFNYDLLRLKESRNKSKKNFKKRSLSLFDKDNSFLNIKMLNSHQVKNNINYSSSSNTKNQFEKQDNYFHINNIISPVKTNYKNKDKFKKNKNKGKIMQSYSSNKENKYLSNMKLKEEIKFFNSIKKENAYLNKNCYKPLYKYNNYQNFINGNKLYQIGNKVSDKNNNSVIRFQDKSLIISNRNNYNENKSSFKKNEINKIYYNHLSPKYCNNFFSVKNSIIRKRNIYRDSPMFNRFYKSIIETNRIKIDEIGKDFKFFFDNKKEINRSNQKYNQLIFLIKSNWGNIIVISFNYIRLLDKDSQEISIIKTNYDISKKYISKYINGQTIKITINYELKKYLKFIEISNGLNDTGIKDLEIRNNKGNLIWMGEVPKTNVLLNKSFVINLSYNTYREKKYDSSFIKDSQTKKKEVSIITLNYELCNGIKINFLENYGNQKYIGLSGINIYDENDNIINIEENSLFINSNDLKGKIKENPIFNKLFDANNFSIEIRNMFLLKKENSFIEIIFIHSIKIKTIKIFNYNSKKYKDCSTKSITIEFLNGQNIVRKTRQIYLYMAPTEENIDFGQYIVYPFNNCFNLNKYNNFMKIINANNCRNIFNEEYNYFSPVLPSGYILKLEIMNNWGNNDFIGLNQIILYDENNNEIPLSSNNNNNDNDIFEFIKQNINKLNHNKENSKNKKDNNNYIRIYLLPGQNVIQPKEVPLFLINYKRLNHIYNVNGENRLYYIFNECTTIRKITIINYSKFLDMAVKDIKILLDGKVIFEGELKNSEPNHIYFYNDKYNLSKSIHNLNKRNQINDIDNNIKKSNNSRYNEYIQPNLKILSLK